jgi:putative ABC transport system permease protein
MRELFRGFIALVSAFVPGSMRREFRAEWEAELSTAWNERRRGRWREDLGIIARAIGSLPDAWCLFRQQWSLDMLRQDVRYALRLMAQRPGFTGVVVLTLALGIGANTAVFTVINAVLLRPLPFKDPGTLMAIWEDDRMNAKPRYDVAPANFQDWREQSRAFEHVAAYVEGSMGFSAGGESVRLSGAAVTPNFFDALGVRPILGDGFTATHGISGQHRVLMLSYDTWQRQFKGDPAIIGRALDVGAPAPFRVVGVLPRSVRYPSRETAYWRPLAMVPQTLANRSLHFLNVIGRRRPGVTVRQAQADMDAIAARQQKAFPATNERRGVTLVPLTEQIVGEVRRPLYVLAAAVFMVLLIGCANVGNLMLIRAAARRRELAIRVALGADRMRIARQLFVEGLMLAGAGAAAGLALAAWATSILSHVAEPYVPRIADAGIDLRVLAFLGVVSVASGLLFALAPVLTSGREDIREALQDNGRTAGPGPAARRLRGALAIGELAAACVLIIGAGLVLKSFWRLMQVSPGFATERVLKGEFDLPQARYPDGPQITVFYQTLLERLRQVPGVVAAGVTNGLPMTGSGPTTWLTIEGRPRPAGEPPEVNYRTASPDYFRALEVPVIAGRTFTEADTATSLTAVVVNRTLVERFFRDQDPLGQRLRIGPNPKGAWRTIVGVVGDMHQAGPESPAQPELYLPITQDVFAGLYLAVRTHDDPAALASTVRGLVHTIDPQVPVIAVTTMEEILGEHVASRRLLMILLTMFAGIALLLSLIGIYGVMGNVVSHRTNEIGVRMALGAQRSEILGMILRDGVRLGVSGLGLGIATALAASRLLRAVLFGVTPTDAATYAAVVVLMLVVCLVACYLPARRAARVDPLTAIRAEG